MTEHDPQRQLVSLVDAFLCCMGQLMLICDHMTRYPASDDADPAPEVLRRLMCQILEARPGPPAHGLRDHNPGDQGGLGQDRQ